ncbi:MAG TPA: hypothetical protein VN682_18980 [Terriglobales bacterium]|nr:hypothetical protein [Terriglobales bacterium]
MFLPFRSVVSKVFVLVLLLGYLGISSAQNPQLQLKTSGQFPTVIFNAVRWNADPSYYSIAIDATGTATYLSAPEGLDKTGTPYTTEFQVSDRTRRIVFNLSQKLDYFAGSYGELQSSPETHNVYTLAYRYGSVNNQYTYSTLSDADLEELTSVFEELSQTFEFGRKLSEFELRNRKAIGPQLDVMKTKADRRALRDLPALVPILRDLAADTSVDAAARKQASSLIKLAQSNAQLASP